MGKVNEETALGEVTAWLDKKKIFESSRDSQKESVDILVEAVMNGTLEYHADENEWTQNILVPNAEANTPVLQLRYRSRLNDNILRPYLKGVDSKDGDARLTAILAALTSTPKGIISALDSIDKKIGMSIAIFFL